MTQMETDGVQDLPLIDVPVAHEERVAALVTAFREQFGMEPEGIAEGPGRVNLIGEHVDYNDGLVLPFAIDRSVMCAWAQSLTEDQATTSAQSLARQLGRDIGEMAEFRSVDLNQMYAIEGMFARAHLERSTREHDWRDYPASILWVLQSAEMTYGGAQAAITGDVPQAAGLSSSAAMEVGVLGAFRDAFALPIKDAEVALLCQRAENEYVGVQCGIMDQFASALSKAGHALLVDCRTLAYKHVPLRLAEHGLAIVIANSAVRRELITSAYNERRRECEEAVSLLRDVLGRPALHSLRDVRADEIEAVFADGEGRGSPGRLSDEQRRDADEIVLKRARHVVSEIERVAEAVDALERDDFARLGELMAASHTSLRDDYEVSSEQLDLLVELASAQEYVLGARLTGAGFGGCTVNLVRAERIEDFARDVIAPYRKRTGLSAVMYVTEPCDGLRTWRL